MTSKETVVVEVRGQTKAFQKQMGAIADNANKVMKSFSDWKAALDVATAAARNISQAFGEVIERGTKYSNLVKNQSINIEAARKSTKGLVDDITLLTAANTAAEFQMGLTADQFAKFAQAAVVQSQRLGIDANKALEDLLTGTARGSRMILDNLGFVVKQGASVADVVAEIDKKVGDAGVSAETAGHQFQKMATSIDNSWSEMTKAITESETLKEWLVLLGEAAQYVKKNFELLFSEVRFQLAVFDRQMSRWMATWHAFQKSGMNDPMKLLTGKFDSKAFAKAYYQALKRYMGESGGAIDLRGNMGDGDVSGFFGLGGKPKNAPGSGGAGRGGSKSSPYSSASDIKIWQQQHALDKAAEFHAAPTGADKQADIIAAAKAERKSVDDLVEAYKRKSQAVVDSANATEKNDTATKSMLLTYEQGKQMMTELVVGPLSGLTAGMWAAADAALVSGQSFGKAMAVMLKQTLLGIAQQATVKAIFNLAEAAAQWYNPVAVSSHLTAAGLYTATAAAAGAAGLGMSAAGVGRSSGGSSAGRSETTRRSSQNQYRPDFGTTRNQRKDVTVNLYFENQKDPAALAIGNAIVKAQMAAA